jgi:hypothetical protein
MKIGASAEFALTAACAVWPPSQARNFAIRTAALCVTDCDKFLRVVRRQRVDGLVHQGLSAAGVALPPAGALALQRRAHHIAKRNELLNRESMRLQGLFDQAGLPNLVLKGATLSVLAYNDLAVKLAWDIDLITDPDAVQPAIMLLQQAGYRLRSPSPFLTPRQLGTFVTMGREFILVSAKDHIFVELKWALDQNPRLLPALSARSPWQAVPMGDGGGLRTLNREALFSYLCVHGARHCFSRLKWLADLAALLAGESAEEIERLYRLSQQQGAHRCSAQALLLSEQLLGTALPTHLSNELKADRLTRWLVNMAIVTMAGGDGESELEARPFSTTRILMSHLLIGRDLATFLAELKLKFASARDRINTPLPRWAGFIYPLIRLPLSVWRRAAYGAAQRRRRRG